MIQTSGQGNGAVSISLADLRARRVPLEWFEAIAVIQELCRALRESGSDTADAALGAHDVLIEPAGTVQVTPRAARERGPVVARVGALLRLALADVAHPVPLRLVITQSCATPPAYGSIAELATALEYFERPDRLALVRAVYERAQGYQPVADSVSETSPEPENEVAAAPKSQTRRMSKAALGIVAALLVVAIGLAMSQMTILPPASAVTDEATASAPDGATAERPSPKQERGEGGEPARAVAMIPRAGVNAETTQEAVELPEISTDSTIEATESSSAEAVATDAGTAHMTPDTAIYSASDGDVTPPLAISPRLPAQPPAGVRVKNGSTVEILVSETGEVESVRLRGRPADLGATLQANMNLSAAKTWRFRPAARDGRPVKYRMVVHVSPSPR